MALNMRLRTQEFARAVAAVCPKWLADLRQDIARNAMVRVLEILSRGEATRGPSEWAT